MIALIDTVLSPLISWLNQILTTLQQAHIPQGFTIQLSNIFSPLAMISPAWSMLISNIVIMAIIYTIIYVSISASGLLIQFKNMVKWW